MQADVDRLADILTAIPIAKVEQLQRGLSQVWQRFLYRQYSIFPSYLNTTRDLFIEDYIAQGSSSMLPQPVQQLGPEDDAFSTLLQWLYGKMLEH